MEKRINDGVEGHHYDEKLFSEKSKLVDQDMNRLVDEFFANEKSIARFFASLLALHASEKNGSNVEVSEVEQDNLPQSTFIWSQMIFERFSGPLLSSINQHIVPILYGYSEKEIEKLRMDILSLNCGVVMERITERISTMDVSSFLAQNKAYLED